MPSFSRVKILKDDFLHAVERIHQIFGRRVQGSRMNDVNAQESEDENDVDERDGRLEEVIVVGRNELADFVDERSEADAPDQRGPAMDCPANEREQHDHGGRHQQPAPEHVGDVQA